MALMLRVAMLVVGGPLARDIIFSLRFGDHRRVLRGLAALFVPFSRWFLLKAGPTTRPWPVPVRCRFAIRRRRENPLPRRRSCRPFRLVSAEQCRRL